MEVFSVSLLVAILSGGLRRPLNPDPSAGRPLPFPTAADRHFAATRAPCSWSHLSAISSSRWTVNVTPPWQSPLLDLYATDLAQTTLAGAASTATCLDRARGALDATRSEQCTR